MSQSLDFNQSKYLKYKIKAGDSIQGIYQKFDYKNLYNFDVFSKKIVALNTDIVSQNKVLYKGRVIILPAKNISFKKPILDRHLASFKAEHKSLEKVNFRYACKDQKDPQIYKLLADFANSNHKSIKELNISFNCKDSYYTKKELEQKLKPWMQSFDIQKESDKNSFFFPYLGLGSTSYSEGSFKNEFSNVYVGLKYRQILRRPTLLIDAEIKYGLLGLNNQIDGSEANLLDMDLRIGHSFNILNEPWHFTLFGGVYYSQLFVKNNLYGYKGITYPQFYPELRRFLKSGDSLSLYLKYIPTGDNFLTVSGKDYSISLGAGYHFDWNQRDLFFKFDYTDLRFESPDNNTPVQMKQYFLSLGVHFK